MFSVPHLSADHVPSNRILVTTATIDIEQAARSYNRNVRNAVDPTTVPVRSPGTRRARVRHRYDDPEDLLDRQARQCDQALRVRIALGQSQAAFAAMLGVSLESYRTWDRDRSLRF